LTGRKFVKFHVNGAVEAELLYADGQTVTHRHTTNSRVSQFCELA